MVRSSSEDRLLHRVVDTRRSLLIRAAALGLVSPLLRPALGGAPVARARQEAGTPVPGGELVVLGSQEVASLSPDDSSPTNHQVVVSQIHNALVQIDENFQPWPVLATDLPEVSDDGLTYTFTLHQGVLFHDGEEFTSADVKYTYEWYMNPDNAAIMANNFARVAAVETPDSHTVIVRMTEPNAAFYSQVANTYIVPAHYHGEIGEDAYKAAPIGTGAFRLVEWRAAEFTQLEAFSDHFRGRPHLDGFRFNVVPEASVRAIALETGDGDTSIWTLVPEDDQRLAASEQFISYVLPGVLVNHLPLNHNHPALGERTVRQAMMFALDRQLLIDDLYSGAATLATSNLSPVVEQYYTPDVAEYPYDPERAAALLDDAGWIAGADGVRKKDGERLSFACTISTGSQVRRPESEVIQAMLAAVGIEMRIVEAPVTAMLDGMRSGELDAALFTWGYGGYNGDPDAIASLGSDSPHNFTQYANERIDELLLQGLAEVDPAARAPIYHEIQQIVAEDVPFLYLMYPNWFTHFNRRLKGLPESILGSDQLYAKAYQWWIDDGAGENG